MKPSTVNYGSKPATARVSISSIMPCGWDPSASVAGRIGRMLTAEWDLDRLLLTGGGARELAEPIGPLLPGEVSLIENVQDLRLNNVQGQMHLARSRWGC